MRGFLVPGSRMAISSWGPAERVPFIAVPMGAAIRTLGIDPPPPGMPGPLSRPTPEALGGLLHGGGFSGVEVEETEVTFEWESPDEFVALVKDTVPPLVALIAKHAPDDPDRAWDAILGAVKETASDDGTVTFSNLVLLAGRAGIDHPGRRAHPFVRLVTRLGHERLLLRLEREPAQPAAARVDRFRHGREWFDEIRD